MLHPLLVHAAGELLFKIAKGTAAAMERKRTKLAQAAPAEVPLTECTADPTEDSTTDKVDIGNGVLVPQSLLARIKASAGKQPTRYARDLLRAVFTAKELAGSSLHGKACNARKDVATKKALDPERLDAVLCKSIMQAPLSPPPPFVDSLFKFNLLRAFEF
ncbi:hypothetical protein HPB48_021415 [Haemaphysalis longicornis]|uniref:BEN domain-containing protein n=1 Tax=Haemaphysalis longicornis TaxID=44386 RepID=A0A9J6FVX7_HAELO|nr:hypothetical protein HPB48_021415 [Haemaphysalis longicornis]